MKIDEIMANIKINDYVNEKKEDLANVAKLTEFIRQRDATRNKKDEKKLCPLAIVGIVAGSILCVALIAAAVYLIMGRKFKDFDDNFDEEFDEFFIDPDEDEILIGEEDACAADKEAE